MRADRTDGRTCAVAVVAGRCRTADREGVDGRWTREGETQKGDDGKVGEHRVAAGEDQEVNAMLICSFK